MAFINDGVN